MPERHDFKGMSNGTPLRHLGAGGIDDETNEIKVLRALGTQRGKRCQKMMSEPAQGAVRRNEGNIAGRTMTDFEESEHLESELGFLCPGEPYGGGERPRSRGGGLTMYETKTPRELQPPKSSNLDGSSLMVDRQKKKGNLVAKKKKTESPREKEHEEPEEKQRKSLGAHQQRWVETNLVLRQHLEETEKGKGTTKRRESLVLPKKNLV